MKSVTIKETLSVKKEVFYHILFWLLLIYFTHVNFKRSNPYYFSIEVIDVFSFFWALVFVFTFYFNYFIVMPRVLVEFNWKRVVLGLISSYLFFVGIRFLLEEVIMQHFFDQSNYYKDTNALYYLYDNLYYSTFPIIPSTLFWLVVFLIRLLEFNAYISEEKRSIEVKFLKAQLNPHFMFNTLNNIYSLVYFKSEKALPAIEKLSSIMRFTTYESQKDYVKLEDEINYIKAFIELEQLRHKGSLNVQLRLDCKYNELQLPPFVLFPLVENAIKHGFYNEETPVKILLEYIHGKLRFEVKNQIGKQNKDQVPGIGLENLKKRLQIYFSGKHALELKKQNNIFTAQLEIEF